ncbi:Protein trichome birefringence-like 2 [Forsythia ovata]|uniref:Protein trichome birefringence-like 2 n=1 Tax=Forsythia ovata TaxID=205694 RepID=A0ABD1WC39_9LAMI
MDFKKLTFSDQFPPFASSPRRKIKRFGLGIVLSFIVLSIVLFNISFKTPFFSPVFQGFNNLGSRNNSSFHFWHFPSSPGDAKNSINNNHAFAKELHDSAGVDEIHEDNSNKSNYVKSDGKDLVLENSKDGNVSEKLKNGSFIDGNGEESIPVKIKDNNGGQIDKNAINIDVSGKGMELKKTHVGNSSENTKNESISVKENVVKGNIEGQNVGENSLVKSEDLNVTDFLERLRGQKLVFVGDSLNRNMWESLVCVLRHGVKDKRRVYEISGRREFKKKGFYAFRFEDYNCTVDFVSSPFLVRESSFNGKNGSFGTLRLDLMDETTSMYHDADVMIFNTGHWWTHEKTSRGEDYYQEGKYVHPRLKVLEAYKRALTTWSRWVNKNIDGSKTQVIFRGYSVTHFRGGPWNSGGQCHKETEPIFNQTHLAKYPSKMRALEHVLQSMQTPVIYLNISRLTDYRKDGHPSVYRPDYQTTQQQIANVHAQDCSHWCLPGVPDTWNELLYVSLLRSGRGSWRN